MAKSTATPAPPPPPVNRIARFEDDPRARDLIGKYEHARSVFEKGDAEGRERKRRYEAAVREQLDAEMEAKALGDDPESVGFKDAVLARMADLEAVVRRLSNGALASGPGGNHWQAMQNARWEAVSAAMAVLLDFRAQWDREVVQDNHDRLGTAMLAEARAFGAFCDAVAARRAVAAELEAAGVNPMALPPLTPPTTATDRHTDMEVYETIATHYFPELVAEIRTLRGKPSITATDRLLMGLR